MSQRTIIARNHTSKIENEPNYISDTPTLVNAITIIEASYSNGDSNVLMKQAGVVAKPISKPTHPALAKPANTAVLNFPPETRGSRPKETLTTPTPSLSVSLTHSPKLSAIASTADGVKSTVLPFSPSNATPLTSEPFCNRRIWYVSSSILLVIEDLVLRSLIEGEDGVKFKKLRLSITGEERNKGVDFDAIKDDVEVDAIAFEDL